MDFLVAFAPWIAESPPSPPVPTPTPLSPPSLNPIEKIQREFGFNMPGWLAALLTTLAIIAALLLLYKPIIESVTKISATILAMVKFRAVASKAAARRARFADYLESSMRRIGEKEEWRDSRFAELEAEVEMESRPSWLSRLTRHHSRRAGRIRRVPSLTVALKKSSERLIILEGDPGSGKSVALRHVAQGMAYNASRHPSEHSVLPLYVNLKEFRPATTEKVSAEDVRTFVLESLNPAHSRDIDRFLEDEFNKDMEEGRWLFLLDSFDEIPEILGASEAGPTIENYADAIRGFIYGIGTSRGIVASREFRGPGRMGWPRFHIMPLARRRKATLIKRADLDYPVEQILLYELNAYESNLQHFATNPLFLGLLCEYVREHGELPEGTHAVMEAYVQSRLNRDAQRIEALFLITLETARALAEEMAFQMLALQDLGLSASRGALVSTVTGVLGIDAEEGDAAIDALIYTKLARYSDEQVYANPKAAPVSFSHRRLQEYFATCVVIKNTSRLSRMELLTNGRWRETAVAVLQTQPVEETQKIITEADLLLRSLDPPDKGPHVPWAWPTGSLHVLDLLANGLKPEQTSLHIVSKAANAILDEAWQRGHRLDKKWVIELSAASGTTRAAKFLTRAFDSESLWLRDQAYAQVRRVGPAVDSLEPRIRRMLVDMSLGGVLLRQRNSMRAQILRLSNPTGLHRAQQLLLVGPVLAMMGGLGFGTDLLFNLPRPASLITMVVALAVIMSSYYLRRFSMASDSRVNRYRTSFLAMIGLGDAHSCKNTARGLANIFTILPLTPLLTLVVPVAWIAAISSAASPASLVGALFLVMSHASLIAVDRGWLELPYRPLILARPIPASPFRLVRMSIKQGLTDLHFAKVVGRIVQLSTFLLFGMVVPGVVVLGVAWLFKHIPWLGTFVGYVFGALFVVGILIFLFVTLRRTWHRAWRRRNDVARLAALPHWKSGVSVSELQDVFKCLQTDEGLLMSLQRLSRAPWDSNGKAAEFLAFIARRMSKAALRGEGTVDIEGEAPEWSTWWRNYAQQDHAPLLHPSSESQDELGRLLEQIRRKSAFSSKLHGEPV